MLIFGFNFLAIVTIHGTRVSRPNISGRGLELHFLLTAFFCSPLIGDTRCEILPLHTMTDAWLMDLDLVSFISIMMVRTIISLKRVTSPRESHLSLEVPGELPTHSQDDDLLQPVTGVRLFVFKSEQP